MPPLSVYIEEKTPLCSYTSPSLPHGLLLITLCKIWGRGMFWQHQQAIHESFLHENLIFHQFAKVFSHESSRYMVRTLFQIACVDKAPDACSLSCYTVNEGEGQLPISYMMT